MDTQEILAELEEFKGTLYNTKKEELQPKISQLLNSPDGIEELQKSLEREMKITSSAILQLIVSQIESLLKSSQSEVDREKLIHLLKLISKNDSMNSAACWSALLVMLNTDDQDSSQILADFLGSNDSQKCLKIYKKFAFDYIEPDGGLPYLLDLYIQNLTQPYVKCLPDLIYWISNQLIIKINERSIDKMKLYFEEVEHFNLRSMDRPLIILATQLVGKFRSSLESVLEKLSPDSSDEQKSVVIGIIEKALGKGVETGHQPPVEETAERKDASALLATDPEDLSLRIKKIEQLLENQDKSRKKEHNQFQDQITDFRKVFDSSQVVEFFLQLKEEKEKNAGLQKRIDEIEQDYYKTIGELEQEKAVKADLQNENAELQEKLDELEIALDRLREERQRMENSNRRIKIESVDYAKNFCISLVSTLDLYLDEAKDSSYPTSTDREKFLLERLREIHSTLQREKKQRLEELRNVKID